MANDKEPQQSWLSNLGQVFDKVADLGVKGAKAYSKVKAKPTTTPPILAIVGIAAVAVIVVFFLLKR